MSAEEECIFILELNNENYNNKIKKDIVKFDLYYEKKNNKDDRILSKSPKLSRNNFKPPPSSSYIERLNSFMKLFKN